MNCAAADAFACDQVRFNSSDILQKTMKTMDRTARLAMLPDHEIFCVDLTKGEYKKCSFFWFAANSGADYICSAWPAKDGSNKLKFITLIYLRLLFVVQKIQLWQENYPTPLKCKWIRKETGFLRRQTQDLFLNRFIFLMTKVHH